MKKCEHKHCCHEDQSGSNSSSFVFGIVIGAVIGAIIAILIYKNNKGHVFDQLKERLEEYFHSFMGTKKAQSKAKSEASIKVIKTIPSKPKKPAPKMFVKPKK
ncbi:MAG: hypothetical protein WCG91_00505 [Candidatus Shapirobacteria bacterium]